MIINKKKVFYALFCAFLTTSSTFGSALDQEAIQILRRVLQKMAPEEIAQIEREGIKGWQKVTINALTQAIKKDTPRIEIFDAVWAQLKSPEELSKFMKTHPDIVSDLKPGLKESIERLMLEGRGPVQQVQASVGGNAFGRNRLQALVAPTDEEMAVLLSATKAQTGEAVVAMASSGQEALPQFLDRTVRQGAAFTESIIPETEKEVLFHAVFPEFKVSTELFKFHLQEWMALLIEHGEFKLVSSTVTERGTQYVLKSMQAGGVEIKFLSTFLHGDVQFTTVDLYYSFQEKGVESLVSCQHHLMYFDDKIGSRVIWCNGESILETVYHYLKSAPP